MHGEGLVEPAVEGVADEVAQGLGDEVGGDADDAFRADGLSTLLGGLFNGFLIARFNITPILCTLGTQMAFTGLAVVVCAASTPQSSFLELVVYMPERPPFM